MIVRKNPSTVAPPIGPYSHLVVIPPGAELLVMAGQVGSDADGTLPDDVADQFGNCLANIDRILKSEGLSADDLVKINIWLTEEMPREDLRGRMRALLTNELPAVTLAFVKALAQPALKAEVEAWAARMPAG